MKKQIRIAIIGGGPGGLTLARILLQRGIQSTVFELDEHPMSRPQGGTLDLHPESGQLALRHADLETEFRGIARYEDQETRLYDKTGKLHYEDSDAQNGDRPEADRGQLRQILIDSLPDGVVRWGFKMRSINPLDDGTYEISFENGEVGVFDLAVGADGGWSRIRPLVSEAKPLYTGVTFVEVGLDDVDTQHPEIAQLVGHGTMFALSDGKALVSQLNSNAHIRTYASLRMPEEWSSNGGLDLSSPENARACLISHFSDWSLDLLSLIANCNDRIMPLPLYALPIGHSWTNRVGITLLGDAAHLMSPFSGEGVNGAMLDAAELAISLDQENDWKTAVKSYEAEMFVRSEQAAQWAAGGLEGTMSDDGLASTLEWMQSQHDHDSNSVNH